jgi:uncharacterized protein (UPF0332 family)
MTKNIKTRDVEKGLYKNYLQKAEENFKGATKSFEEGSFNAAAVSAVHTAISCADAFCVFGTGKRCASENHKDASALIMDATPKNDENDRIRKLFDSIIRIKNMAEYEERLVRLKEAEKAVREAAELLESIKMFMKEK